LLVRATHWLNAAVVVVLLMSGLQIFNAHTALYASDDSNPSRIVFSLPEPVGADAQGKPRYRMVLFGHAYATSWSMTAVPPQLTMGGWLAGGRRVHFAAAVLLVGNGLLYLGYMAFSRRRRAAWPQGRDFRRIPESFKAHLKGQVVEPGGAYNPLQKIAYAGIALGLGPLLVATGLAMSPQWDALFPFWTDMFGGRQMARTLHFVAMGLLAAFIVQHITLVALAGWPHLRRMITGKPVGGSDA
jgi:thiosulfate reductase cytochrome b subunit